MLYYLASPYSHHDPAIQQERYDQTCEACYYLSQGGIYVISPIAHWHPIADRFSMRKDAEHWKQYNFHLMEQCTGLFLLALDGWAESIGIAEEIEKAHAIQIPVRVLHLSQLSINHKMQSPILSTLIP